MACAAPAPLPTADTRLYLPGEPPSIRYDQPASFSCYPGHRFEADPDRASYDVTCREGAGGGEDYYEPSVDYGANSCVVSKSSEY